MAGLNHCQPERRCFRSSRASFSDPVLSTMANTPSYAGHVSLGINMLLSRLNLQNEPNPSRHHVPVELLDEGQLGCPPDTVTSRGVRMCEQQRPKRAPGDGRAVRGHCIVSNMMDISSWCHNARRFYLSSRSTPFAPPRTSLSFGGTPAAFLPASLRPSRASLFPFYTYIGHTQGTLPVCSAVGMQRQDQSTMFTQCRDRLRAANGVLRNLDHTTYEACAGASLKENTN